METGISAKYASAKFATGMALIIASLLTANSVAASNPGWAYASETAAAAEIASAAGQTKPAAQTCLMAEQLKDPAIRADYDAIIADTEGSGLNRTVVLDPISMECLGCHDGTIARPANHRISDGNPDRTWSIATIKGSHPVGMDYDRFARSKEYVPSDVLPANIVLINGRVGCTSCHNLLGSNDKYLAVDNHQSRLCFSCHNK